MTAAHLFVLVLLAPVAGAAFALVLPADDRLTLRAVGVVTGVVAFAAGAVLTVVGGATLAVPGTPLALSGTGPAVPAALTVLGVTPMALRAGAPRVQSGLAAYVVAVLGTVALSVLSIVLTDPRAALGAATVAAVPPFALVALFGGPERGSVSYRAAGLWILADVAALAALVLLPAWRGPVLVVAALGPGLVRLAAGPWGLWALPVIEQAPVSAACLVPSAVAPVGAMLLLRVAAVPGVDAGDVTGPIAIVLAIAGAGGAALVVAERDLRRLVAHVLGILGAFSATGFLAGASTPALTLVLLSGFAASLALMVVEAIERRLETRRVPDLAGLFAGAPLLGALLPFALLALAGLPWPGTGAAVWQLAGVLTAEHAGAVAVAGVVFAAALLVVATDVVVIAGRAALPGRRRGQHVRVSFLQGIRLLLPVAALVCASTLGERIVAMTAPTATATAPPLTPTTTASPPTPKPQEPAEPEPSEPAPAAPPAAPPASPSAAPSAVPLDVAPAAPVLAPDEVGAPS
jgi:NADH:ubiquinone oxidoreductase subunit 4 (subunit M)